jgi:hypothetical protein
LVANPRIDESYGFAGNGYLGWSQDSVRAPNHYDLFLHSPDGQTVRLNTGRSQGYGGGIDGNTLVYDRVSGKTDDLWSVDLTTMIQSPVAGTVTSEAEYTPTISADWILFGRGQVPRTRVLLYNRSTGETRQLASVHAQHAYAYPGQVSGNYAVWGKITHRTQTVYLYDIAAKRTTRIAPQSGRYDYDPAVSAAGSVFFVRSPNGCGKSVGIYRQPLGGSPQLVQRLPSGFDSGFSLYTAVANGQTELLYTLASCRTRLGDVYGLTVTG